MLRTSSPVYLDNAAAEPVSASVLAAFAAAAEKFYANPESLHAAGRASRVALGEAADRLRAAVGVGSDMEVLWTASATEALGVATRYFARSSGNIVATAAEHPAVTAPCRAPGVSAEFREVGSRSDGQLDGERLTKALDGKTRLVAVHHVQNEIGAAQDLASVRAAMTRRAPRALLLSDTAQSIGKLPFPGGDIDFAAVGGHKIGAPCGGALLWRRRADNAFAEYVRKLRQESHEIGRPDPAVAIALAVAAEEAAADMTVAAGRVAAVNATLRDGLRRISLPDGVTLAFTLSPERASPYILNFTVAPFQAAVLVRALGEEGVMVSAGSACEAETGRPSQTLLALGMSREQAYAALRVSFGRRSVVSDAERFLTAFQKVLTRY